MAREELADHSALEMASLIKNRKASPVEVTQAVLDRISRVNPLINALILVPQEEALCSAKKAEEMVMRGAPLGPLHGVPFHVKDNLIVAGSRTTFGSKLFENNISAEDCPAVARLRAAGMILVGRSNTPEFGWKGVTDNRVFGITRNPWNPDLTPGGSSGGSTAAVAAGMGPVGVGTDGGGSLRIPASFCGVVGFKPTFGRVPNLPGSSPAILRHVGTITRTVADMAATVDIISGPDDRDLYSVPLPPFQISSELKKGIKGVRIAYSPNFGYASVDQEVAEICQQAARQFVDLGAHVETVDFSWPDPYPIWSTFFFGTAAAAVQAQFATQNELLDPGFKRVVEQGLSLKGVDFANALTGRHSFWEKVRSIYDRFDLVLSPTLTVPPFPVGQDDGPPVDGKVWGPLQWTQFTYPFNLTGQPVASVPAGWTREGLPIGIQIIGNRHADRLVLQAAWSWEQLKPWVHLRPKLS